MNQIETIEARIIDKIGYETQDLLKPKQDRLNQHTAFGFTGPDQEASCDQLIALLKDYDKGTCKKWTEEIDTLLVFAGLFSAIVTAFVIASFAWLQLKAPDDAVRVLLHISEQIQVLNPGATSNIAPAIPLLAADSPIDYATARHINALWFSSLSLALTAALVGILCKQWVRLYPLTNNLDSLKAFSVRQMRHDGLASYGVPATIASISIFLETAVILFFVGLVYFTWNLDRMVALPVLIIAALAGIFLIVTTITPFLQYMYVTLRCSFDALPSQCPWKSPQSWLLIKAWNLGLRTAGAIVGYKMFHRRSDFERREYPHPPLVASISSWSSFDHLWTSQNDQCNATLLAGPGASPYISSGLPWALEKIESPEIPALAYHMLAKAIQMHDKHTLRIFDLNRQSIDVAHRASMTVSKSRVGNAHLVKAVIDAKGEDFLHQYALEDERRIRINHTVPTCLLAAFKEWATCSILSSSCSGEFTQATLLYLTGITGPLGVEHCARVITAHLGHKAKGNVFPPNATTADIEYKIPSAVHVLFSAHMATIFDGTHNHWMDEADAFVGLGQMLLDLLQCLLENNVVHINTHDEYKVSGREFLLANNIPRLPLRTLAYFPDIIRYCVTRASVEALPGRYKHRDAAAVPNQFLQMIALLNDFVRKHSETIDASVLWSFQKLIGQELCDMIDAINSRLGKDYGMSIFLYVRPLIESLQMLQESSSTETPAKWRQLVCAMQSYPPPSESAKSMSPTPIQEVEMPEAHPTWVPQPSGVPEPWVISDEMFHSFHLLDSPTSQSVTESQTVFPAAFVGTGAIPHGSVASSPGSGEHYTIHLAPRPTLPYPPDQLPAGFVPTGFISNNGEIHQRVLSDGTLQSGSYDCDQGKQLDPSHSPTEKAETPGARPSRPGSHTGTVKEETDTDTGERDEDVEEARTASWNKRSRLSDTVSSV